MVDISGLGVVCVTVFSEKDLGLIVDSLRGDDLTLTQDLLINDKVLDEGKSLTLVDKTMVHNVLEVREKIAVGHTLTVQGKYSPPIELAFANMAAMHKTAGEMSSKIKRDDEARKRADAERQQRELEEQEALQDRRLLESAGDLSYAIPAREWVEPETTAGDFRTGDTRTVKGGAPALLSNGAEPLRATGRDAPQERRITKYMTAEPDAKGVRKVYIEETEVVEAEEGDISVEFSMNSYTVRVRAAPQGLLLGPVDCGLIDPRGSSWRLSRGKRLTIVLKPTEAGAKEANLKKEWEANQAKARAQRAAAAPAAAPAPEAQSPSGSARAAGVFGPLPAALAACALAALLAALWLGPLGAGRGG